jgi:cellobiose phosphorylase
MANPQFELWSRSLALAPWEWQQSNEPVNSWLNDPVGNTGRKLYLRDEESGICWTPTPLPIRELDAYRARHGQGYTVFEHSHARAGAGGFVPVAQNLLYALNACA